MRCTRLAENQDAKIISKNSPSGHHHTTLSGCIFATEFGADGILPGAKFTLRPSLAFSYIGSVTVRHSSSGH